MSVVSAIVTALIGKLETKISVDRSQALFSFILLAPWRLRRQSFPRDRTSEPARMLTVSKKSPCPPLTKIYCAFKQNAFYFQPKSIVSPQGPEEFIWKI